MITNVKCQKCVIDDVINDVIDADELWENEFVDSSSVVVNVNIMIAGLLAIISIILL